MSDHFDRWLAQHGPTDQADPQVIRRVGERIRDQRRARRRVMKMRGTTAALALLVVASLTLLQVPRLGSGNRSTFIDPERPDLVRHPLGGGTSLENVTQPQYERYLDRVAARRLLLVGASFYRLGDEVLWNVELREPEGRIWGREPVAGVRSDMSESTARWLLPWMGRIEETGPGAFGGELSATRATVDGHELWFRRWKISTVRGDLIYGEAVIERPRPQRVGLRHRLD